MNSSTSVTKPENWTLLSTYLQSLDLTKPEGKFQELELRSWGRWTQSLKHFDHESSGRSNKWSTTTGPNSNCSWAGRRYYCTIINNCTHLWWLCSAYGSTNIHKGGETALMERALLGFFWTLEHGDEESATLKGAGKWRRWSHHCKKEDWTTVTLELPRKFKKEMVLFFVFLFWNCERCFSRCSSFSTPFCGASHADLWLAIGRVAVFSRVLLSVVMCWVLSGDWGSFFTWIQFLETNSCHPVLGGVSCGFDELSHKFFRIGRVELLALY